MVMMIEADSRVVSEREEVGVGSVLVNDEESALLDSGEEQTRDRP